MGRMGGRGGDGWGVFTVVHAVVFVQQLDGYLYRVTHKQVEQTLQSLRQPAKRTSIQFNSIQLNQIKFK